MKTATRVLLAVFSILFIALFITDVFTKGEIMPMQMYFGAAIIAIVGFGNVK